MRLTGMQYTAHICLKKQSYEACFTLNYINTYPFTEESSKLKASKCYEIKIKR